MSFVVAQKWVIWRRAADKVAAEAATGPEKMKSTARCSSGHSQASSWLFWWRIGDASGSAGAILHEGAAEDAMGGGCDGGDECDERVN
jgi:hypothetical protein